MRAVIVTGQRQALYETWKLVIDTALGTEAVTVIHGASRGIDTIAEGGYRWFPRRNFVAVPAQWEQFGNAAGPKRNEKMLDILKILRDHGYDVEVLAFHDDLANSKGTGHMVRIAKEAGIPVRHFTSDGKEA